MCWITEKGGGGGQEKETGDFEDRILSTDAHATEVSEGLSLL